MTGSAEVDVLVLHHNSAVTLDRTLEALQQSTLAPRRVVVLDNSADQAQQDDAALHCDRLGIEHVELPNEGYGAAMNRGLALLDAPLVLLLTHESVLAPDCLERLVRVVQETPDAVALGPLLARHDAPARVWSAGGLLHEDWHASHRDEPADVATWADLPPHDVTWLDGAVLLLRRDAVLSAGGFDERYFLYWEEVDLQTRLAAAGGRLLLVPSALAWQSSGSTWAHALIHRNRLLYVERAAGLRTAWYTTARYAWRATKQLLLRRGRGHRREAWDVMRGTWAYLTRQWGLLR